MKSAKGRLKILSNVKKINETPLMFSVFKKETEKTSKEKENQIHFDFLLVTSLSHGIITIKTFIDCANLTPHSY